MSKKTRLLAIIIFLLSWHPCRGQDFDPLTEESYTSIFQMSTGPMLEGPDNHFSYRLLVTRRHGHWSIYIETLPYWTGSMHVEKRMHVSPHLMYSADRLKDLTPHDISVGEWLSPSSVRVMSQDKCAILQLSRKIENIRTTSCPRSVQ